MDMLRIGLSSLTATQLGMSVVSNNIANSSTEGYARQQVSVEQIMARSIGGSYFGQGVLVDDVIRIGSEYLETSLRNTESGYQFHDTYYNLGVEVDKILSDQDTGLDKTFQEFFTAVGDLANSPTSEATRSVFIDTLGAVGSKFESMSHVLQLSRETADKDLSAYTDRLNALGRDLISVNESILDSKIKTGEFSSQLIDKRYQILGAMSELVDIETYENDEGVVSVYVGEGKALVANNYLSEITASSDGFTDGQVEIYIRGVEVTNSLKGGKLGGTIQYRDSILESAENEIGRISLSFGQMINAQHKQGYTPAGVAGGDLVSNFSSVASEHTSNAGTGVLTVSFDTLAPFATQVANIEALQARTYEIVNTGAGYDVLDAKDGAVLASGMPASFTLEGLSFDVTGAVVAGDSFKISPMKRSIDNQNVIINDTDDFANSLTPAGSVSDNRNSLAIFSLQDTSLIGGGVDSFQGAYSTIVASIGSKVSSAESASITFQVLSDQAQLNRDTESGVNIEEEAASLIKLQQQYSASAKVIAAAQDIFDELLSAIG